MSERQMVWSVAGGGTAVLQMPDQLSLEDLDLFEEACQIMFRGWRRRALGLKTESWSAA